MDELSGCWWEAQRCDRAVTLLFRMRNDRTTPYHEDIIALIHNIEKTSLLLRDLHDLFPLYSSRVHIITQYLTVILPCLSKTLRDMMIYIDNEGLEFARQWVLMNERLDEQGRMLLAHRFVMYIEFLVQCIRLLTRSVLYDPTSLELLRQRVLRLRALQGMPPPPISIQPHLAPVKPSRQDLERRHWAEKLFEQKLAMSTGLKHKRKSRCNGPPMTPHGLGIEDGSNVLFKLPFDKNRLSVIMYEHPQGKDITRFYCRFVDTPGNHTSPSNPMFSCYGVQELCIRRRGSCLQFKRLREGTAHVTVWLALFFKTYEKLVIFHSAFVALKARCPLTINVNPDDYRLEGETKRFSGQIIDDGYEHILAVFQDNKTGSLRLHVSVWSGELRRCPVWTAFVPHDFTTTRPHHSRHRVLLPASLQILVFCQSYKKRHQICKHGEFEVRFVNPRAADMFEDLWRESSDGEGGSNDGGQGE